MADRDRFGGSERDYLPSGPAKGIGRSGVSRLGDLPGAQARPRGPWDQDFRWNRGPSTTVPEGFNDPDRFGRMRPTQANNPYAGRINNNPMGGANIGGGWNMYEGRPERGWYRLRNNEGLGSFNNPFEETEEANLGWRTWQELQKRFGTDKANEIMEQEAVKWSPPPITPGRPHPHPIGRPPWLPGENMFTENQLGVETDVAASDEYRQWNSIRRKYGEDVANQMMGHVTANRGGIMGLI